MRIVCWQKILKKYHTLFYSKIRKDVRKIVVFCSRDWRFKGSSDIIMLWYISGASIKMQNLMVSKKKNPIICVRMGQKNLSWRSVFVITGLAK